MTYEYDAAGSMTAIRENGGALLASFGYDDLGRRTRLVRGNGVTTSYGYDGASRLTGLTDAYAWTGSVNVDGQIYGERAEPIYERERGHCLVSAW